VPAQPSPLAEAELWALIDARTQPGADTVAIDAEIWRRFGETWAIVFTDLTGFSRMVAEFGIIHFLQEIHEQRRLFLPLVRDHGGILVKEEADSMLLLFERPARAIECVIELNRRSREVNRGRRPEDEVLLCAGIGYGQVLRIGERDVFGQEVNAASKLGEDLAKAGEIFVTDAARVASADLTGATFSPIADVVAGSATNHRVVYTLE
jgi:adenylate cyclase